MPRHAIIDYASMSVRYPHMMAWVSSPHPYPMWVRNHIRKRTQKEAFGDTFMI